MSQPKGSYVLPAIGSFLLVLALLGVEKLNRDRDRLADGIGRAASSLAGGARASVALVNLLAAVSNVGASDRSGQSATARECGVILKKRAQRFFANPDGHHGWHEYQTVKEIPELGQDGDFAALWTGPEEKMLVRMYEPTEDWSTTTDYCFDGKGRLLRLRFELRTAWKWGFRKEGPVAQGALTTQSSEFLDLETQRPIKKPDDAEAVAQALIPRVFLQSNQLPFYSLLLK